MAKEDEFELIPLSPIRKLEKRIAQLEMSGANIDTKEFFQEFVDIVKMNQQLVDELIKANTALRVELSRLPGKIGEMTKGVNELLSYIKAAAIEEANPAASESFKVMPEKMDRLIELNKKIVESNETLANLMETMDKKMRPVIPFKRPILSSRPLLVKP
jgi:chromosome segregation ATPase